MKNVSKQRMSNNACKRDLTNYSVSSSMLDSNCLGFESSGFCILCCPSLSKLQLAQIHGYLNLDFSKHDFDYWNNSIVARKYLC